MTDTKELSDLCNRYLKTFCIEISERSVGSEGNRRAKSFFNEELDSFGWRTETPEFKAMDWHDGGSFLKSNRNSFIVNTIPYSLGCSEEAENVIGRKGIEGSDRIVITAHIDAKKGTPGAIDNATGVTILLLLARLLKGYSGTKEIEIVALNGEDYFAVPGQMDYVKSNENKFSNIVLNINIDGAGYKEGMSSFSLFGLPDNLHQKASAVIKEFPKIVEGAQWPHAGSVSHEAAIQKSETEYHNYQVNQSGQLSHVEKDFLIEAKKISTINPPGLLSI